MANSDDARYGAGRGDAVSRRTPAVRKKIEVVPTPVLEAVKGQAPSRVADRDPPIPLDLLPPLTAAVRATLVDSLADLATAELDRSVNTADSAKESTRSTENGTDARPQRTRRTRGRHRRAR